MWWWMLFSYYVTDRIMLILNVVSQHRARDGFLPFPNVTEYLTLQYWARDEFLISFNVTDCIPLQDLARDGLLLSLTLKRNWILSDKSKIELVSEITIGLDVILILRQATSFNILHITQYLVSLTCCKMTIFNWIPTSKLLECLDLN